LDFFKKKKKIRNNEMRKELLFILFSITALYWISAQEADGYEDEDEEVGTNIEIENCGVEELVGSDSYEYEYEDETVEEPSVFTPPVNELRYGYYRHGGGLMKIGRPLVDESYINHTVDYFDCVRMIDSMTQIVESNVTEEVVNVTAQIAEMKKKMDKVLDTASRFANNGPRSSTTESESQQSHNTTATTNAPTGSSNNATSKENKSEKRLSFREKQALRLQQRKEKELQREMIRPKYRLGADCETLLCGSCKAIVEEFGNAVYQNLRNPQIKYIDQLIEGFCQSKNIVLKYHDIVGDVCQYFEQVISQISFYHKIYLII
jgi:hypothetical protein